jgi:hypothetical protein
MGAVISINQKRFFTLEDAKGLFPVVQRLTRTSHACVKQLSTQLSYTSDPKKKVELEQVIQRVFREWYDKIRRLGCEAKGMWLVDFDSGDGYYCWHFPEPDVQHFHGYAEGFRGRMKIH